MVSSLLPRAAITNMEHIQYGRDDARNLRNYPASVLLIK